MNSVSAASIRGNLQFLGNKLKTIFSKKLFQKRMSWHTYWMISRARLNRCRRPLWNHSNLLCACRHRWVKKSNLLTAAVWNFCEADPSCQSTGFSSITVHHVWWATVRLALDVLELTWTNSAQLWCDASQLAMAEDGCSPVHLTNSTEQGPVLPHTLYIENHAPLSDK